MITQRWEFRVPGTPEQLWPFAGDTERFNRMIRTPAVTYQEAPDPRGGIQLGGSFHLKGIPTAWHELPYEWREPEEWSVRRIYTKGPMAEFFLRLRLLRDGEFTRLAYDLELTPRAPLLTPLVSLIASSLRAGTKQFAERLEGWAAGRFDRVFTEPLSQLTAVPRERLASLSAELVERGFAKSLVERLAAHLATAPDYDLLRIRPYTVADRWSADRRDVLTLFLHATRLGLLEMSWDLVCPECRGAKERTDSLSRLRGDVHCSSCNIDFKANFDSSVELTFRPAPAIRKVDAQHFCAGGPGNTPHRVFQQLLGPGASESLELPMEPGAYRLRSPHLAGQVPLNLGSGGDGELALTLSAGEVLPPEHSLGLGGTLRLQNADQAPLLVILERVAWADDIVRASAVTALQEFRDLFDSQILAPGVEMGISRLAFLFSDLKASTAMYAIMGDAPAFALVQDHFRILEREVAAHRGAIVKTIGDAIMAVFDDPGDCARAGLAIQQAIAAFNSGSNRPPISVKLGAHLGPVIAVSLNERLDYFGTTVNVAARVQGEAHGDDLVLTTEMLADPGVRRALSSMPLTREAFEVRLKGLERPYPLTRFQLPSPLGPDRPAERLVERSGLRSGDAKLGSRQDEQESPQ